MKKEYWVVEFNETGYGIPSYRGRIIDEGFIALMRVLDDEMAVKNRLEADSAFLNGREDAGEVGGYYKFYLDHYEDEKVVEHIRIDVGDGAAVNDEAYQHVLSSLKKIAANRVLLL
ncbi:MAG: hypothetical protein Q4D52_05550 [Eubacteriales bacterium]|nr:hypothetical protein [Eubacteriales bacterium]